MFDNDTEQDQEDITEFGMRKSGEHVQMWVTIDGHEVFYAEPHVKMCKGPIQAGVQTFLSRAYQQELIDMATDDSDSRSVF